jgi:hypothetical protein
MTTVLEGLLWGTMSVNIDDIVVFTMSKKDHLVVLREVFERMRALIYIEKDHA